MNAPVLFKPPITATKDSWPPDYVSVWGWRQQQLELMRRNPKVLAGALAYYKKPENASEFILHWCDTYDPRRAGSDLPAKMPFIMFERQIDLVDFVLQLIDAQENGLVEKARDMGATWLACAVSVWIWAFVPNASVGWGSRKEALVDKLGDLDSIFEKMRFIIRNLPSEFHPIGFNGKDHMPFMRILNPKSNATITGEAGDNIGRGGRKLVYFKDESAHYERPELVEAALMDNTRVQIDISSVNGVGNVFYRRRKAGKAWQKDKPIPKGKTSVFVMRWQDHPDKNQAWYNDREERARDDGLLHLFRQEVDRKYEASVQGIVIPAEYVEAAVDAHKKLGFKASGGYVAGLDVADEGLDQHGLAVRKGPVCLQTEERAQGDTGDLTRWACGELELYRGPVEIQYDCIGVGAGVKAESNRLLAEGVLPRNLTFVPWNAAGELIDKDKHLFTLPNGLPDTKSPTNHDFFGSFKSQAWWNTRLRFERTWKAVTKGQVFDPSTLVSLPSDLPGLDDLMSQLSQATITRSTATLKLIINKTPDGTKSPNRADAFIQAYWPALPKAAAVGAMFIKSTGRR